jgi:glycosyltransferase involved in cell wall biosynthesis
MKVLIASTIVPFIEGGGTFIVDWLAEKLNEFGYTAETLKIPFCSYAPLMLEQLLALKLMDVSQQADLLITIRTPSYLIEHPNKVAWFIHHHRAAYDLWGSSYQDLPNRSDGYRVRDIFYKTDTEALSKVKRLFTNSKVISDRLMKYNHLPSEVLYPPLLKSEHFFTREYGDFVFYPSRITSHKRQHLIVEAMKYTRSNVRLVVAGKPDEPESIKKIEKFISENHLENKVTLLNRWISEEEKAELWADSLAGIYIPQDEDSYGYVSLEASHSKKAILTCKDSGGTLELIEDGFNGWISEPTPEALAVYIDRFYENKTLAKKMGENALARLDQMGIHWPHIIDRLTMRKP